MKKCVFYLLICTWFHCSFSQIFSLDWVRTMEGTYERNSAAFVDLDGLGNIYTAGHFQDSIDLDPTEKEQWVVASDIKASFPGTNGFIQKFDKEGGVLWSKHIGIIQGGLRISSLAFDNDNNVIVSGDFCGEIVVNEDTDNETIISARGVRDVFILKFDSSGNLIWSEAIGGLYANFNLNGVRCKSDNSLYIVGDASGKIDFNNSEIDSVFTPDKKADYIIVMSLNDKGKFEWMQYYESDMNGRITGFDVDSNDELVATGKFKFVKFNNTLKEAPDKETDMFVCKIGKKGDLKWVNFYGSLSAYSGCNLVCDKNNDLYINGLFSDNIKFDKVYKSKGEKDLFLLKINSEGKVMWSKHLGSGKRVIAGTLLLHAEEVVMLGYFLGDMSFQLESGTKELSSEKAYQGFMLSLDYDGKERSIYTKSMFGMWIVFDGVEVLYSYSSITEKMDIDPSDEVLEIEPKKSVFVLQKLKWNP